MSDFLIVFLAFWLPSMVAVWAWEFEGLIRDWQERRPK